MKITPKMLAPEPPKPNGVQVDFTNKEWRKLKELLCLVQDEYEGALSEEAEQLINTILS